MNNSYTFLVIDPARRQVRRRVVWRTPRREVRRCVVKRSWWQRLLFGGRSDQTDR